MEMHCTNRIDKDSDGALVGSTKRGDTHAFEKLVLRHQKRVLAVAQRITRNREDAEDVAQESFHKAFLHLGNFQERSRFSTWLTRIAMNEAIMLLRRRRRFLEVQPLSSGDDVKSVSEAFIDQRSNPEESCWRRERTELLTGAINRLGPRMRRTILLCIVEERSVKETAQVLGISTASVKSRLFHGRRLLGPANLGRWRGVFSARRGKMRSAAMLLTTKRSSTKQKSARIQSGGTQMKPASRTQFCANRPLAAEV
jgi:RNA polymerase sigma factor (sigma-70 family)